MRTNADIRGSFKWLGEVTKISRFYEYTIVEYLKRDIRTKEITDAKYYGTLIDGRNLGHSYSNYDAAIVGCIGYKHDGCNTLAPMYFMKMINKDIQT